MKSRFHPGYLSGGPLAHFFISFRAPAKGPAKEGCEVSQASRIAAPALSKTSEGRAAEVERLIAGTLDAMDYDIVRVLL